MVIETGRWKHEVPSIIFPTFLCFQLCIISFYKPAYALTTMILEKQSNTDTILAPDCQRSTPSSCSYQLCGFRQVTEPLYASVTLFPNGDGDDHEMAHLMLL